MIFALILKSSSSSLIFLLRDKTVEACSDKETKASLGNSKTSITGLVMEKKVLLILVIKFKFKSRAIKVIDNIKQITKFIVTEELCLKSGGGVCDRDTATIYSVARRGANSSTLSIASPQPRTTHVSGSSAR